MSIYNVEDINKLKIFKNIINNKGYDELYTMYGKNIYNLFTPSSYKKQDIEKLMNNNDLGTIYNKYGSIKTLFIKNFRKRKKEDIKRLLLDKRYIELYNKYGEEEYNKHILNMYENDISYEAGSKVKAKLYRSKKGIGKGIRTCIKALSLTATLTISFIGYEGSVYIKDSYAEALATNSVLLQEYNDKITNYAEYVNSLELDNDLDVVMKVMHDMWDEMQGYGEPTLDINSLGRLAFAHDNGVGVCRNIADDFSARMNAINPEYNARDVAVYIDFNDYNDNSLANIDRTIIESNDTVIDNNEEKKEDILDKIKIENIVGNHMVSIFEPIGKDYTLVVDATNPSIGIIVNGEIYIFSNQDGKGLTFKPMGQLITIVNYDYEDVKEEFEHHFFNHLDIDDIKEISIEWGIDSQNASLDRIENLNTKQK